MKYATLIALVATVKAEEGVLCGSDETWTATTDTDGTLTATTDSAGCKTALDALAVDTANDYCG